jgi:hypothetical protein
MYEVQIRWVGALAPSSTARDRPAQADLRTPPAGASHPARRLLRYFVGMFSNHRNTEQVGGLRLPIGGKYAMIARQDNELDEGWLLLTHGVGPVRKYSGTARQE